MRFFLSIIYGCVSGITEFLPISSESHQKILGIIFGFTEADPVRDLYIHIAIFIALFTATGNSRRRIFRSRQKPAIRSGRRGASGKSLEYRFIRNTAISFLILFFVLWYIIRVRSNLLMVAVLLGLNGIVLFIPERVLRGNKNAKVMSKLDSALIGASGALSAFSGFSRVGCIYSGAALRGAERKASVNWALLLSIPAVLSLIILDIFAVFSGTGGGVWNNFLFNISSAIFSFIGARIGIYFLRRHLSNTGLAGYAYYCWGAALFALVLFLTVA